jgi:hypothetical protein
VSSLKPVGLDRETAGEVKYVSTNRESGVPQQVVTENTRSINIDLLETT